jgi:hypothetical protein
MCGSIVIEAIIVLDIRNYRISMEKSLEIAYYLSFGARLKICPKVKVNLLSKSFFHVSFNYDFNSWSFHIL